MIAVQLETNSEQHCIRVMRAEILKLEIFAPNILWGSRKANRFETLTMLILNLLIKVVCHRIRKNQIIDSKSTTYNAFISLVA